MCGAETGERSAHNWQYDASLPVVFTCSMLVLSLRMQTKLRECQNLGRIAATNARRLEGEKVALQAALATQEQRLLAQADQERAAWQQERAQLHMERVAEQTGLQTVLEQERVLRVQVEEQLQGAHREYEAYVDRVRALVPPR